MIYYDFETGKILDEDDYNYKRMIERERRQHIREYTIRINYENKQKVKLLKETFKVEGEIVKNLRESERDKLRNYYITKISNN